MGGDSLHEKGEQEVRQKRERAEQQDRKQHHEGRAFQLVAARPGAFLQLFLGLRHVVGQAQELARPPEHAKGDAHEDHPDQQLNVEVYFHKFFGSLGGEGGIRTPVGLSPKAVFKTAAIDHSATSPKSGLARREGLEPPTNGFGDRYSTN